MSEGVGTTKNNLQTKPDPFPKEASELSQAQGRGGGGGGRGFHTGLKTRPGPVSKSIDVQGEKSWVNAVGDHDASR